MPCLIFDKSEFVRPVYGPKNCWKAAEALLILGEPACLCTDEERCSKVDCPFYYYIVVDD